MIKVHWDVEELVALIAVYNEFANNVAIDQKLIVERLKWLSDILNLRAGKLGIDRDSKFRNLNGMKMMLQNVAFIATNGKSGLSGASKLMREVYEMSKVYPDVYENILEQFMRTYADDFPQEGVE